MVIDECFTDFLDEPSRFSLSDKLSEYENLFILKAFTKFYAMAGLRLGYGLCANGNLLKKVRSAGQPWAVSSLAQAGGIAALKEKEYEIRLKELLKKEKPYLSKGLSDAGLKVFGGAANYLFFRSPDEKLHQKLREKGILIRDCSNYKGLCEGYYRTAIRRREENEKLLSAIENTLKGR